MAVKIVSGREICSGGTLHWIRPSDQVHGYQGSSHNIRLCGLTC
jgi:hypothetical protein